MLHKEIFFLLTETQGGFTHSEVYNLPISLRRFYVQCAIEKIEKRNEAIEKQNRKNKQTTPFRT
tara:strand:- start:824 stop:1015 length:192 start_codon:yes stop_codon:yes gene_type:complete